MSNSFCAKTMNIGNNNHIDKLNTQPLILEESNLNGSKIFDLDSEDMELSYLRSVSSYEGEQPAIVLLTKKASVLIYRRVSILGHNKPSKFSFFHNNLSRFCYNVVFYNLIIIIGVIGIYNKTEVEQMDECKDQL
jgi:hypothetical protein